MKQYSRWHNAIYYTLSICLYNDIINMNPYITKLIDGPLTSV